MFDELKNKVAPFLIAAILLGGYPVLYFWGKAEGQNKGLRQQDTRVISELRQNNAQLKSNNILATRILNDLAKTDSTANVFIQNKIKQYQAKK